MLLISSYNPKVQYRPLCSRILYAFFLFDLLSVQMSVEFSPDPLHKAEDPLTPGTFNVKILGCEQLRFVCVHASGYIATILSCYTIIGVDVLCATSLYFKVQDIVWSRGRL